MPKREGLRPKPYPAEKPSDTFMNFIKNIRAEKRKSQPYPPSGVTVNEFLTYKKAKFLLQINQIRDFLRVSLNIKVLNGLEATLENIMYFAVNCDSGYLTLQVRNILTENPEKSFFHKLFTSVNFRSKMLNFKKFKSGNILDIRKVITKITFFVSMLVYLMT